MTMADCIECSDENTCTKCKNNYYINKNTNSNTCESSCPLGTYTNGSIGDGTDTCEPCSITMTNCEECINLSECAMCRKGFYKIDNFNTPDACLLCSTKMANCAECKN